MSVSVLSKKIDFQDRGTVANVLRCVPRRFVVMFAARCARRVQPELLLSTPLDRGLVEFHLADGFLKIAEFYSAGQIKRLDDKRDYWRYHHHLLAATPAYAAAAYAAYAADASAVDADGDASVAAAAAAATARGVAVSPAERDFEAILTLSRGEPEDFLDDRPVPADFFGPLWSDGMPAEYERALARLRPKPPAKTEVVEDAPPDLDDEEKAALADERWVSEQYSLGTFDEYRGEYVAVVGKKLLGHGKRLKALREEVTAATGIPASRIVTTLIVRSPTK